MKRALFLFTVAVESILCTHALLAQVSPKSVKGEEKTYSGSPVVKEGARLRVLADVFEFTEGPATDRDGNVYFTDQPNNRIMV